MDGVRVIDITDPGKPLQIAGDKSFRFSRGDIRGVAVNTVFDIGSAGGGLKSQERDYLYIYAHQGRQEVRQQHVHVYDISDPVRPRRVSNSLRVYGGTGKLELFRAYNAPFLQHFVVSAGSGGIGTLVDVSKNKTGLAVTSVWGGINRLRDIEFEEFAFDRLQDERGRMIKDISHEGCRYLTRDELLRVLNAAIPDHTDQVGRYGRRLSPTKRRRRDR